jgi:multiple antibiotic resistance protein
MIDGFPDTTLSFFVTSVISLFVIVDPTGNIFPFLALSAGSPPGGPGLAGRACVYSFVILAFFVALGRLVLQVFGISLPAFQIAGGLVLFRIAFDMMEGRGHFNRLDTSSSLTPGDYRDLALIPLAMPLLAGPGAISTVLVLTARSKNLLEDALLVAAAGLIMLLAYIFFRFAAGIMGYPERERHAPAHPPHGVDSGGPGSGICDCRDKIGLSRIALKNRCSLKFMGANLSSSMFAPCTSLRHLALKPVYAAIPPPWSLWVSGSGRGLGGTRTSCTGRPPMVNSSPCRWSLSRIQVHGLGREGQDQKLHLVPAPLDIRVNIIDAGIKTGLTVQVDQHQVVDGEHDGPLGTQDQAT